MMQKKRRPKAAKVQAKRAPLCDATRRPFMTPLSSSLERTTNHKPISGSFVLAHRFPALAPGQSSVRNGEVGSPFLL